MQQKNELSNKIDIQLIRFCKNGYQKINKTALLRIEKKFINSLR